jgi:hypothetical protein
MRLPLIAALSIAAAVPAFADETQGKIVAFDRVAHILVLSDMTVWTLDPALTVPENLAAGDTIEIVYEGKADDGIGAVTALTRTNG